MTRKSQKEKISDTKNSDPKIKFIETIIRDSETSKLIEKLIHNSANSKINNFNHDSKSKSKQTPTQNTTNTVPLPSHFVFAVFECLK